MITVEQALETAAAIKEAESLGYLKPDNSQQALVALSNELLRLAELLQLQRTAISTAEKLMMLETDKARLSQTASDLGLMGALTQILDGEDTGQGVAPEPWETLRRRVIAMKNDLDGR